eukprot:TRINITY_DN8424_c0_g1::TRINITY_DN8424_c0_g1_i1::g.3394::m.3394 TRINITY_DN8424_c0_g1::TRINITY_DN8424_c0_g1_i1::g.3394  ORF type:complete len:163 (-),score=27.63,sp/Q6GNY6/OSTCA_XENLA/50.00/2e-46,OST3_OST6/PF04756.8/3.9e-25,Cytochrom_B_N/PF00033.14/0.17,Cytochrom_B_N/PF00033.14/4.4e+02 TRINITY_DN8424_c0_g1_i1:378-836(-)
MDFAQSAIAAPFVLLRPPKLTLKQPFSKPSSGLVFGFLFFTYFLVMSGILYDMIVEPPAMGSAQDPATGAYRPVAFLQYRVNGQYIIEGLSAGFMFSLGGLGFILLDWANDPNLPRLNKWVLLITGFACAFGAYNITIVFLRIKMPGYLITY